MASETGVRYQPNDVILTVNGMHYQVFDIKRGGMGVVYLCHLLELNTRVALKTLKANFLSRESARACFIREALTWSRLGPHPHIVQAFGVDQIVDGTPFIILEYVAGPPGKGTSLREWMTLHQLNLPRVLQFAVHICAGMEHVVTAIPGLVHRDLKPENILITQDEVAKVTDFGLVKVIAESAEPVESMRPGDQVPVLHTRAGTWPYMPPEQYQGSELDHRSDIYAFGCTLYEMLTGHWVFAQEPGSREWVHCLLEEPPSPLRPIWPDVPVDLEPIVLRCLEKSPQRRYTDWHTLREDLAEVYTSIAGHAPVVLSVETEKEKTAVLSESYDLHRFGVSLAALGDYQGALLYFDQALQADPNNAEVWLDKGVVFGRLERHQDELDCLDQALELGFHDPQPGFSPEAKAWMNKGNTLQRLGRLDEALSCFDRSLDLDDTLAMTHYNRGNCLLELNRPQQALQAYEHALALDPTLIQARNNAGAALERLGQTGKALSYYEAVLEVHHNDLHASVARERILRGHAGASQNRAGHEAIKSSDGEAPACPAVPPVNTTDRALKDGGSWVDSLMELLESQAATDDEAAKLRDRFSEAFSQVPEAEVRAFKLANRGSALLEQGRLVEAVSCFDEALKIRESMETWLNKGTALDMLGSPEEAVKCYDHAARVDPASPYPWYEKGVVLLNTPNRYQEAIDCFDCALGLDPQDARFWFNKGVALAKLGRWRQALPCFEKAQQQGIRQAQDMIAMCKAHLG